MHSPWNVGYIAKIMAISNLWVRITVIISFILSQITMSIFIRDMVTLKAIHTKPGIQVIISMPTNGTTSP